MEQVNHPKHYNSHPKGIECIEIIRHYTFDIGNAIKYLWRAGLKPEKGKEDAEKEIEDLQKALWYVEDYKKKGEMVSLVRDGTIDAYVESLTGYDCDKDTLDGFDYYVRIAMGCLLRCGVLYHGDVYSSVNFKILLETASGYIFERICNIEDDLLQKSLQACPPIKKK